MWPNNLQHPDITRALRTGYPQRVSIPCEWCGMDEAAETDDAGRMLCRSCALDSALERRDEIINGFMALSENELLEWGGFYSLE